MIKHKFKAKPTTTDGIRFDSKLEADFYQNLKVMQANGFVILFHRQVPFDLPGGVKYRVDFQVFWENGNVEYIDVKGYETPEFIMKKKMVEDLYPITITVIKANQVNRV